MTDTSHRTAVARTRPSAPVRFLLAAGLLRGRLLDWGCGRGLDAAYLGADAYDPYWRPEMPDRRRRYDTVLCTYVLNVLPTAEDRTRVLRTLAWWLRGRDRPGTEAAAYVTVRNDHAQLRGNPRQWLVRLDLPEVRRTSGWVTYRLGCRCPSGGCPLHGPPGGFSLRPDIPLAGGSSFG